MKNNDTFDTNQNPNFQLQEINHSEFRKDAPFKYMHSRLDDPRVMNLNKTIIENVLKVKVESLIVLNNELTRRTQDDKHMTADVVFLLNGEYIVNFEMQNNDLSDDDMVRFQSYDAELLLTRNIKSNYNYEYSSKPVIQIIFAYDPHNKYQELVSPYGLLHFHNGDQIQKGMFFVCIVHLPYINTIVKQKGIENLDDNEIHTYLLANGADNAIIGLQNKVLEDMLSMKDEFDQEALQRAIEHNQERKSYVERKKAYIQGKEFGVERGIEQGKELGIYETQKQVVIDFMRIKYPDFDINQLDNLTLEQYKAIYTCLIQNQDLEAILAIIH